MRRRGATTAIAGVLALAASCASAQSSGARTFKALVNRASQAETRDSRELRLQWTVTPSAVPPSAATPASPPTHVFKLIEQRRLTGGVRRERNPEVSANQLVIVVLDSTDWELDYRLVNNPRFVRAEQPGAGGQIVGRVLEQDAAELLVTIPDVPGADHVRIYQPVWDGRDFNLEPLAQVAIGSGR